MEKLNIKIVSDLICPWCYIARVRLGKIIGEMALNADFHWLPYELNPDMPEQGLDRIDYRSKKFGSIEYSKRLDLNVVEHAKPLGINIQYDKITRTPNTSNGHRLIWLGEKNGISDAVSMRLFKAYFEEGKDVGDVKTLKIIGVASGLEKGAIDDLFATEMGIAEIKVLINWADNQGVESVPFIIVNNQLAISGAQSDDTIKSAFKKILGLKEAVVKDEAF